MIFDIFDSEFHRELKEALLFMTAREPPYLIHREAGIDRTGFLGAPVQDKEDLRVPAAKYLVEQVELGADELAVLLPVCSTGLPIL